MTPAYASNGSIIFLSITARVTESVDEATPMRAASSVSETLLGTSKYPSTTAWRRISRWRFVSGEERFLRSPRWMESTRNAMRERWSDRSRLRTRSLGPQ